VPKGNGVMNSKELHGLDTDKQVFFYEQDFYVLSNFSSFQVRIDGVSYPTSEHAYHCAKFEGKPHIQEIIRNAPSAHEAFKDAADFKSDRVENWDEIKYSVMKDILIHKVMQHEYVRRKLLDTGDRELIENSWRDDVWGWGHNKSGQNLLGKCWMEIRAELKAQRVSLAQ